MDIKRKKKEKRIQLLGGLIGICVAVISLFYFFHAEKAEAEKRMVEIVNYVKVQCSTYTHYNESSESKSLLRAIESARQMSTNIDMEIENGGQLRREFLKENLKTLWVDGILVLDTEGKTDCEYSTDESLTNEITAYLQKDIIMDFAGYEERSYSERFTREDGSRIDIAACARKDEPGIVAIYYYTSLEFTRNYTLTIQGLLKGYSTQKDGTIIVADNGIVVASNDESLLGQNTADNEVVQAMKRHTDSQHIYHLKNEGIGCYGIMLKQRDYYIYAYLPDTEVFHNLPFGVISVIFFYFLMFSIFWFWTYRTNLAHRKQEQEKDEKYKAELLIAAKKAETANEAKTEFLQRMSHDIRTPINGIRGLVNMADHYADDIEKQTEYRTKVKEASNLLLELVNDVLDMSKLESGEIVLEEVPFNLSSISEEVLVVIRKPDGEEWELEIEKEYEEGKRLDKMPRILITGCPIGGATEKVIRAVEDNGGVVVAFENCNGAKSFDKLVDEENPDVYDALARRYLNIGCSVMTPNPNRLDLLDRLIDEFKVDGVVEMTLQACHTYNVESLAIRKFVNEKKGIPYINVETDYSQADIGQLNTRIAAFIEML